jgi:predicted DNA-binding transcriptional regulator AlpA
MSETPRAQLTQSEQILDEDQCAQLLGIAHDSLQELRRRGEAPPYARIGRGKIVYLKTRLVEWIDERLVRGKELESQ